MFCGIYNQTKVFINKTFAKYSSWWKCHCKFAKQFLGIHLPSKHVIYKIAKIFCKTVSVLDKKPKRKYHVLNEEKLNKMNALLEVSPQTLSRSAAHFSFW